MKWDVVYLPEALDDLRGLDGSQRILVRKAIQKVTANPLPEYEGGYGKVLGNKNTTNLSGFLKIKLRGAGLRIVYKGVRIEEVICVVVMGGGVVVGGREDDEVYEFAHKRIRKHGL